MPPILSIVCAPFIKAYAYLSWTGLLAIPLWVAAFAILLKFRHDARRNVRYFRALVFALAALILADIAATSASKIVIDRTEEIEAARAQQRHSRINEFGEADMASQMHFVEDSPEEKSSSSSMSGDSTTALDSLGEGLSDMSPEHRFGEKKQRAAGRKEKVGNATEIYDKKAKEEKPPRMMKEADVVLAGRVNWVNLRLARLALIAAFLLLIWDYLVRFNRWMPGYLPLPIAAPWIDSMSPKDFECTHREDRKDAFLRDLVRRGESFIVATNGEKVLDGVSSIARLDIPFGSKETAKHLRLFGFPVLAVSENDPRGWEFVFDAVWFNRYAIVYDGNIEALLDSLKVYLSDRYETGAAARRTVNLVTKEGQLGEKTARRFFLRLLKHANWRLCEFVPAPVEESRRTEPAPQNSIGEAKVAPASSSGATATKPARELTPEEEAARKAKSAAIAAKFAKMAKGGDVEAKVEEAKAEKVKDAPAPATTASTDDAAKAAKLARLQAKFGGKSTPVPSPTPKPSAEQGGSRSSATAAPQPAPTPASAPEGTDAVKAAKLAKLQARFGGKAAPAEVKAAEAKVEEVKAKVAPAPAATASSDDSAKAERLARLQAKFGVKSSPSASPSPSPAASPADALKAARIAKLQAKFGGKTAAPVAAAAAAGVAAHSVKFVKKPAGQANPAEVKAKVEEVKAEEAKVKAEPVAPAVEPAPVAEPQPTPAPIPESGKDAVPSPSAVEPAPEPVPAEPVAPTIEATPEPEPVQEPIPESKPEPVAKPVVEPEPVPEPVAEVVVPAVEPEPIAEPVPSPVVEVPVVAEVPSAPAPEVVEVPAPAPSAPGKMSFGRINISLDDLDLPPETSDGSADDDEVVVAYSRELQGASYADVSAGAVPPPAANPSQKKILHTGHSQSAPSGGGKHGIKIIRKKK